MFILPPPPRFPNGSLYTGLPGGVSLIETSNTLEHPTGPEHQLVVGEGTYKLKDDLHIATPPPHPSDIPQPNHNPLATNVEAPTAGCRLSLTTLGPRKPPTQSLFRVFTTQSTRSARAQFWQTNNSNNNNNQNTPPNVEEETRSPQSDNGSTFNGFQPLTPQATLGDNNPALTQVLTGKGRKDLRAKPKNNIIKSNSSFVSRVIPHDALSKRLAEHSPDGLFAFANLNRSFVWLDLSSEIKVENMSKILFTKAHVLCHDLNPVTKSSDHLDFVLGFNTSDIIWYEPLSQKYSRLNKNGQINKTAVQAISWVPGKENLFIAAHFDGTLVVYDKEREDAIFQPDETSVEERLNAHPDALPRNFFRVLKSVQSRDQRANPVAAWQVSNSKCNNIAFSPDGKLLAVVCADGTLTILDYLTERVRDVYRSYYGGLLCVTWSPDGRYVLTGGQDDIVSIWSIEERMLVARGIGHDSWVTDVKFDPWRCDDRNYRFASVGEDCRLLLWDFSAGMIARPRNMSVSRGGMRTGSIASQAGTGAGASLAPTSSFAGRVRSNSNRSGLPGEGVDNAAVNEPVHAVEPKARTAILPPVASKSVDSHPLCWVGFEEHAIITSCLNGHVREWERPKGDAIGDASSTAGSGSGSAVPSNL